MLNEYALPQYLWAKAVNTICYIINRVHIRKKLTKTPFELYHLRKPNISYFKIFECKCFVLNTKDVLGKFDVKSYESIFIGYSSTSKAYRYIKSTLIIEESMYVKSKKSNLFVKNVSDIQVGIASYQRHVCWESYKEQKLNERVQEQEAQ